MLKTGSRGEADGGTGRSIDLKWRPAPGGRKADGDILGNVGSFFNLKEGFASAPAALGVSPAPEPSTSAGTGAPRHVSAGSRFNQGRSMARLCQAESR
jgi:hypothetical protein